MGLIKFPEERLACGLQLRLERFGLFITIATASEDDRSRLLERSLAPRWVE